MKIIETESMKKLVADENKQIRAIDDVYFKDENGEEYFPYYSKELYLPKNLNDEEIMKMYVED